jgi:hypothetical protein
MSNEIESQATPRNGLWGWGQNRPLLIDFYANGGPTIPFPALISYIPDGATLSFASLSKGYISTHVFGIKSDGTLWAWGENSYGELGTLNKTHRSSPVRVGTDTNWQSVYTGEKKTFAIKTDNSIWFWGRASGSISGSVTVHRSSPMQFFETKDWSSMDVDLYYCMAIKTDGTLWGWGFNAENNIDDSGTISYTSPVQIGTDSNWKQVSINLNTTQAVKTDGTLWTWGRDNFSYGNGYSYSSPYPGSPIQADSSTDWDSVSKGRQHTLAIKKDGTLWSWGYNTQGNLGNNNTTNTNTVIQVGTDTDWSKAFAQFNSFAIKKDGTLWSWGINNGTLGINTFQNDISSPVQVGTYLDGTWIDMVQTGSNIALANFVEPCCLFDQDSGMGNIAQTNGSAFDLGYCQNGNGDNYQNNVYGIHVGTYVFDTQGYPDDAIAFMNNGITDAIEYTGADLIGNFTAPDGNTYPYYHGLVTLTVKKEFDYAISFHNYGRVASNTWATNQQNGIRYYDMCVPVIFPTPTPTPTATPLPNPPSWTILYPVDPATFTTENLYAEYGLDSYSYISDNHISASGFSLMTHMTYGSPRLVEIALTNFSSYPLALKSYFFPTFEITIPAGTGETIYTGVLNDGEYVDLSGPSGTYEWGQIYLKIEAFPAPTLTPTPSISPSPTITPTPSPSATPSPYLIEVTSTTNVATTSMLPATQGWDFDNTATTSAPVASTFTFIGTTPRQVDIFLENTSTEIITVIINGTTYTINPGQTFGRTVEMSFGQTVTITGPSGNYAAGSVSGDISVIPTDAALSAASTTNVTTNSLLPTNNGYDFDNTAITSDSFESIFEFIGATPKLTYISLENNSTQAITVDINGAIYTIQPGETFGQTVLLNPGDTVTINGPVGNYAAGDVNGTIILLPDANKIAPSDSENINNTSLLPTKNGWSFENIGLTGNTFENNFTFINATPAKTLVSLVNNSPEIITVDINGTVYTVNPGETFARVVLLAAGETVNISGPSGNYAAGDVTGEIFVFPANQAIEPTSTDNVENTSLLPNIDGYSFENIAITSNELQNTFTFIDSTPKKTLVSIANTSAETITVNINGVAYSVPPGETLAKVVVLNNGNTVTVTGPTGNYIAGAVTGEIYVFPTNNVIEPTNAENIVNTSLLPAQNGWSYENIALTGNSFDSTYTASSLTPKKTFVSLRNSSNEPLTLTIDGIIYTVAPGTSFSKTVTLSTGDTVQVTGPNGNYPLGSVSGLVYGYESTQELELTEASNIEATTMLPAKDGFDFSNTIVSAKPLSSTYTYTGNLDRKIKVYLMNNSDETIKVYFAGVFYDVYSGYSFENTFDVVTGDAVNITGPSGNYASGDITGYIYLIPITDIIPVVSGSQFYITIETAFMDRVEAEAYAYIKDAKSTPIITDNPEKWTLYKIHPTSAFFTTSDLTNEKYGPYFDESFNEINGESLGVVLKITYNRRGYGITTVWVPILKKDDEQYQELKFYGINNWHFV